MEGAILFLLGFSAIVSVYEVAKTGCKSKSSKIEKSIKECKKVFK